MSKVLQSWSHLLGGLGGPVSGALLGCLFFGMMLCYAVSFTAMAGKMELTPRKWSTWPTVAPVICLAIATAAMFFVGSSLDPKSSTPKAIAYIAVIVACIPILFVPVQMIGMKGSYFKHVAATVVCVVMTGVIMVVASSVARKISSAGKSNRARLEQAREKHQIRTPRTSQPQPRTQAQQPPPRSGAAPSTPHGTSRAVQAPATGAGPDTSRYRNMKIPERP